MAGAKGESEMNKGKWILGAVVAVLIGLLIFSIVAPNLGDAGVEGAPVTEPPFEQRYEKETVRSYVSCPVTGTEPLDAAMQKLVTEAATSFLLKSEEVEPGTEESLEIKYEVLEDGAEQYRIKFLTSAVHLGRTLERKAEITFDRETGEMLAASDGVLPELPLPVSETPVQTSSDGNGKKRVAFTFDDGPTKYTPQLLDLLKERNIKITFFLQGQNISRYPETVKRAYAEGHILGNHTYDHANLYKLDTAGVVKEISGTNEELQKLGLPKASYFRPPYGNLSKQDSALVDVPVIMWSVDPRDWESKNAEKVKASILEQATDGSIILVHDTNMGSINGAVAAMDELRARGYEIVNIPELLFSSSEPVSGKKYFSAKS